MAKAVALFPTPICPVCGKMSTVEIPIEKLSEISRWRSNRHRPIQDIVPELSADDRELMMTGLHPDCWKEALGEEE